MKKKNLAVFISGHGSNLNVFLEHKQLFNSLLTISSSAKAYGLIRSQNFDVPSVILSKEIDWEELHLMLVSRGVDLIFLAGFMKVVPSSFIEKWAKPIFNIHPSLLPKYKGLHAIKRAYEAHDDVGVTIHHVVSQIDSGEAYLQKVALKKEEAQKLSLEEVIHKTHECEHQLVKEFILSL